MDSPTEITNEPIGDPRRGPHGIEGWFYDNAFTVGGALALGGAACTWHFGWFADSWSDTFGSLGLMAVAAGLLVLIRRLTHRLRFGHLVWFVACLLVALGWFALRDRAKQEATGPNGRSSAGVIEARRNHWHFGRGREPAFEFVYRWQAGSRVLRDVLLSDDPGAYAIGDTVFVRWAPSNPEVHVAIGVKGETLGE